MIDPGYVTVDQVGILVERAYDDVIYQITYKPVRDCFHVAVMRDLRSVKFTPGAAGILQSDIYSMFKDDRLDLAKEYVDYRLTSGHHGAILL